jgi:hypothetical protein
MAMEHAVNLFVLPNNPALLFELHSNHGQLGNHDADSVGV